MLIYNFICNCKIYQLLVAQIHWQLTTDHPEIYKEILIAMRYQGGILSFYPASQPLLISASSDWTPLACLSGGMVRSPSLETDVRSNGNIIGTQFPWRRDYTTLTHLTYCKMQGIMSASWSSEGYWYLGWKQKEGGYIRKLDFVPVTPNHEGGVEIGAARLTPEGRLGHPPPCQAHPHVSPRSSLWSLACPHSGKGCRSTNDLGVGDGETEEGGVRLQKGKRHCRLIGKVQTGMALPLKWVPDLRGH